MQPAQRKIRVSVPDQTLELVEDGSVVAAYRISTSRFGTGSEEGSYKTPVGKFRIAERIGEGNPEGAIFKSREPEGVWPTDDTVPDEDLVLSRILWLEGLEEHNANTKDRFIYIHGTNHEDQLGQPASIGCIRMRNADVVALYDHVAEGTPVEILA